MSEAPFQSIGIVGAGLVGLGWAIVYARAGLDVQIYDANEAVRDHALERMRMSLSDMTAYGLVEDVEAIMARVRVVDTLAEAVAEADYVQESVLERVEHKQAVCHEIGSLLRAEAVCGSSTSGIPGSQFTQDVPRRERFLVVHPVNPPHLVPLVELVAAPWTDPAVIPWLRRALERVGQAPIEVRDEIEGFVLNRLQGALLNEAWALYAGGAASLADIDRAVSHGLGLRWSFMGPFETIDLNAPGGIADYASRLSPLYFRIAASRAPVPWAEETVERATRDRRAVLALEDLTRRSAWRDRQLMRLAAVRQEGRQNGKD